LFLLDFLQILTKIAPFKNSKTDLHLAGNLSTKNKSSQQAHCPKVFYDESLDKL
jgi:hypothetical protein